MHKPEPQFVADRWPVRPDDLASDPGVPAPWHELDDVDLAAGTFPRESFTPEESTEVRGQARTRITFVGADRFISDESFHRRTDDEDRRDEAGHTGRDLLRAPPSPSLADRTPLWRIMNRRVVCVQAELGTTPLVSIMLKLDLRSVAVVDDDGRPIGVVSRSDLIRHQRDDGEGERVADVMMCLAFSLPESATLSRAAAVMAYEGVRQIPVVAPDGEVVGLITSLDVVRWLAQHDGYLVGEAD